MPTPPDRDRVDVSTVTDTHPVNMPGRPRPPTPDLYGWGPGVTRNQQGTPIPEWRRHVALRAATSLYSGKGSTGRIGEASPATVVTAARVFAAYLAGATA